MNFAPIITYSFMMQKVIIYLLHKEILYLLSVSYTHLDVYKRQVKGGLTGYAQVYGKYNTSAYDKLKLDLMYIQNYSILMDIEIIFKTIKVLFMKESTEGVKGENREYNSNDSSMTVSYTHLMTSIILPVCY